MFKLLLEGDSQSFYYVVNYNFTTLTPVKGCKTCYKKNPQNTGQEDLFRARLEAMNNHRHPLVQLSKIVDWDGLENDLLPYYCEDNGRPGNSIRMMVGLCIIKDKTGLSNETLCEQWCENPYYQYFCGEE